MYTWGLVALAAGCVGAEAMPLGATTHPPALVGSLGLFPGESMTYEVELGGVLVGEAQLAVGEVGTVGGRRAVIVSSRAATAGIAASVKRIVDESNTVIDVETGRPIQLDSHIINGDKTITATTKFIAGSADVTYRRQDEAPRSFKISGHSETLHDMHTAMALLRGWHAQPGTSRSVFLIGGRRLWRIDVTYVGETTIGSREGNRRAVVFEGLSYRARRDFSIESKKPARSFRVWLSDDADRVPLKCSAKTELGDIVMELADYSRP